MKQFFSNLWSQLVAFSIVHWKEILIAIAVIVIADFIIRLIGRWTKRSISLFKILFFIISLPYRAIKKIINHFKK